MTGALSELEVLSTPPERVVPAGTPVELDLRDGTAHDAVVRGRNGQPVLELIGVSRVFEGDAPVHALRGVDLTIWPGEWLAIVGPSGSGKSTLLNVVGLLDRHSAGTYLLEGVDVNGLDDLGRAGLRGRRIGFVFQAFHLMPHRSVLENVMLAELYVGGTRRGRQDRALAALDRVGLSHRATFLPTRLSGGERQRAAIARALLGEPSLLLCDEPTGNLDSRNAESVLDLFDQLSQDGLTLVVITHDEHVASRAHRRVRITDGVLVEVEQAMAARGSGGVPLVDGAGGVPLIENGRGRRP